MIGVKKRESIFFVYLTLLILGLFFVGASHDVLPASFSVDESVSTLFNISVNNTDSGQDANITQVNITLPSGFTFVEETNETSSIGAFINDSGVLSWENATEYLINGSEVQYFWFNATIDNPGDYNITITTVNATGSYSSNISVTVNSSTLASFGTNPVDGSIRTNTSVTFDLKCSDNSEVNVSQLWGNWSSGWHANFTNSTPVNNSFMNVTIGGFSDGVYLWGVYCNDSSGNSDWTDTNRSFVVDTTDPTVVSFSCSASSVYVDDTLTCSCTSSDATSGVLSTSYTASPSTSTSGVFSTDCTVTDNAGNTATSSISYTVNARSSGAGSNPLATWSNTIILTDEQFEVGYSKKISSKNRFRFSFGGETHHAGVKSISGNKVTVEVSSTPQEKEMVAGEVWKVNLNGDSTYDVEVALNSLEGSKADLMIKYISEEIVQENPPVVAVEPEEVVEEEQAQITGKVTSEEPKTQSSSGLGTVIFVVIVIAVIAFLVAFFIYERKKR